MIKDIINNHINFLTNEILDYYLCENEFSFLKSFFRFTTDNFTTDDFSSPVEIELKDSVLNFYDSSIQKRKYLDLKFYNSWKSKNLSSLIELKKDTFVDIEKIFKDYQATLASEKIRVLSEKIINCKNLIQEKVVELEELKEKKIDLSKNLNEEIINCKKLNKELINCKQLNEVKMVHLDELENQKNYLYENLKEKTSQLEKLKEKLVEEQTNCKKLNKEKINLRDKLTQENIDLSKKLNEEIINCKKLTQEKIVLNKEKINLRDKLTRENIDLSKNLNEEISNCNKLTQENIDLSKKLKKKTSKLEILNKEKSNLEEKLEKSACDFIDANCDFLKYFREEKKKSSDRIYKILIYMKEELEKERITFENECNKELDRALNFFNSSDKKKINFSFIEKNAELKDIKNDVHLLKRCFFKELDETLVYFNSEISKIKQELDRLDTEEVKAATEIVENYKSYLSNNEKFFKEEINSRYEKYLEVSSKLKTYLDIKIVNKINNFINN